MLGQAHRESDRRPVQACPIEFGSIFFVIADNLYCFAYLSISLSLFLSIYLSIYLSMYLSVMLMGCVATKFKWRVTATVALCIIAPSVAQAAWKTPPGHHEACQSLFCFILRRRGFVKVNSRTCKLHLVQDEQHARTWHASCSSPEVLLFQLSVAEHFVGFSLSAVQAMQSFLRQLLFSAVLCKAM